jgi:hypothetical protein
MLGAAPLAVLASRALASAAVARADAGVGAAGLSNGVPASPPPTLFNQPAPTGLMQPSGASLERLRRVCYRRASPRELQLVSPAARWAARARANNGEGLRHLSSQHIRQHICRRPSPMLKLHGSPSRCALGVHAASRMPPRTGSVAS